MNSVTNSGLICIKNRQNVEFALCKIEYTLYEDETFRYVFTPNYEVIGLLGFDDFQGIPGLNLSLGLKEYVRENIVPVFISERVPSSNREDFYELLERAGLSYMDPIEYLIKTDLQYFGDNMYLTRYRGKKKVDISSRSGKSNSMGITKMMLDAMSHGDELVLDDEVISNSKDTFNVLSYLYGRHMKNAKKMQSEGINRAKKQGKYRGRKPKEVDSHLFLESLQKYQNGLMTIGEVLSVFDISKATFFRLKKKYQNEKA